MTLAPTHQRMDPEFTRIIQSYNEVTERLKHSHELLRDQIGRLTEELKRKNRELQRRERLAALGEMAAGVAHEIRNPLGAIGLYASMLECDLQDLPAHCELAGKIGKAVRALEGIVSDTLCFARGAEPDTRVVAMDELVLAALAQVAARAASRRVRIEVPGDLAPLRLNCDPRQIERVIANLLGNAIDAVDEGGRVWLRGGMHPKDGGTVVLWIEDDGPGIPRELLSRIFDPFFTTKHTGTGLGLAISHRIVEAHGGRLTARNRRGGGASFALCMPAAQEAA